MILKKLNIQLLCLVAVAVGLIQPSAHGDLIVEISNSQITARSTGFVNVYVRSLDGTPIDLAGFSLEFKITDTNEVASSGALAFLNSFDPSMPDDPQRQNNDEQRASDYVFKNHTDVNNFAANIENGLLTIQDSTFDENTFSFADVQVGADALLLARLEIGQTQSVDTQVARGRYRIELNPSSSRFYDGINAFEDYTLIFSAGTSGLVNVNAVPEPSSAALLLCASSVACVWSRRRVKVTETGFNEI